MDKYFPIVQSQQTLANKIGLILNPFPQQKELEDLSSKKIVFDNTQREVSKNFILDYFQRKYQCTPQQMVTNYINRVNCFARQGGFGHAFYFDHPPKNCLKNIRPDHWIVPLEHYQEAKPTDDEHLALEFHLSENPKFRCYLSFELEHQHLGN